VATAFDAVN